MLPITLQTTSDLETLRESCELECKLAAGQDGKGELPRDFWKSYSAMAIREEMEPNNRTILELHVLDLFDPGILDVLRISYGSAFVELEKNAQLALAITLSEGRLTHARLCELSNLHPSDVSKVLRLLVDKGFLSLTGSGRGAVYRFTQVDATSPDDVFGSGSSTISEPSSTISEPSSTISGLSSR